MNNKEIKQIHNEIFKTFDKSLEEFLETIEGYKDLNHDQKQIAKIFACAAILMKFKNE